VERELRELRERRSRAFVDAGAPDRELALFQPGPKFNPRKFDVVADAGTATPSGSSNDDAPGDLQLMARAARARMEKQKAAERFSTQAMRDLEALKRSRVYRRSLLRVQFPDRLILQANFSPIEKVSDVLDLVAAQLKGLGPGAAAPAVPYLYTTPPLRRLDADETLQNLGLVPAALVYLGWEGIDATSAPPFAEYLNESALASVATQSEATADVPVGAPVAGPSESSAAPPRAAQPQVRRPAGDSTGSGGKVPKWFKLG